MNGRKALGSGAIQTITHISIANLFNCYATGVRRLLFVF
jgi:hypothetical protein